ncbi:TonB-dependent receptor [Chitinophaga sp. XS-30]|uniref:TonB-dependent receptor n=1 Tax=Chitinophaga sp. XS-30 TaxID=2604421 RepID=UPI0011DCCB07|nr:TonB-dependent receptor [Chitinophaga sp. XS-30]QEH40550.1 TonB-dependent receptor plug domain-containing protein [Chitinophaga sp. XS-30]
MRYIFTALFLLTLIPAAMAQVGTVSGTVVDGENGDLLIGVNIRVKQTNGGAVTGIDGKYNLKLPPGKYTLEFSYVSYQSKLVEQLDVKSGGLTSLDIALSQKSVDLQQVVITASAIDNSEVSVLRLQKNSLSVQDGISSQEIAKIGFSNSAESMKRVTGASVEGGKFIVMRGLGDRYSISQMDGMSLPSTDPYRNSASMDLIPSTMVDNIVVKKTFTPDLPGNFTGGAVDITTKSLPDRFYLNVSASVGINDQATFNNNFLSDPIKGKTDWLGFDDGSRKRPDLARNNPYMTSLGSTIANIQNNPDNQQLINDFNTSMRVFADRPYSVSAGSPGLNRSLNLATGNRFKTANGNAFGFNLGLNYQHDNRFYDNRSINNYKANISSENRMQRFLYSSGSESQSTATVGGIASAAYQFGKNEVGVSAIYNNTGDQSVLNLDKGSFPGALSSGEYRNRVIGFQQRSLLNTQLKGKHMASFFGETKIEWAANYILSSQYEPDLRFLGAPVTTAGTYYFVREVPNPFHFFRDLKDNQYMGKLDLTSTLKKFTLKYGGFISRKERDFTEYRYQLSTTGTNPADAEYLSFGEAGGDFDRFFSAGNTGVLGKSGSQAIFGNSYEDQTQPSNLYEGYEQVMAAYLMGTFNITPKLKTVVGARIETTDYEVAVKSSNKAPGKIDALDVLPSLNFIYALNDKTNLRLSGSRTLARPNMREMAPFISFDLLGGFPIVGNPDIERTNITNVDFRYELFPKSDELFAVSLFYKNFQNPIVTELDATSDQPQYKYVNSEQANLAGAEIEFRKGLAFIDPAMKNFKFGVNFTYIYSRVRLRPEEYEIRKVVDPELKNWRPFAAQSPYIFNLLLSYDQKEKGWESTVFANLFGPRLSANGAGAAPDVYEVFGRLKDKAENRLKNNVPVPELNFRIRKQFKSHFSVALNVNNILDYDVVNYQEHNGEYFTTQSYNPGRVYKLTLGYSISR